MLIWHWHIDEDQDDTPAMSLEDISTKRRLTEMELDPEMDNRRQSSTTDDSGNTTLVNQPSFSPKGRGWTGSLPNAAGPSSVPYLGSNVPGKFPSPSRLSFSDETFAERFKYLICSSGLLEKDYVPAILDSIETEIGISHENGGRILYDEWVDKAIKRWDLVLAGGALVIGLAISLGVWTVFAIGLIATGGASWYASRETSTSSIPSKADSPPTNDETPQIQALSALTGFITQSHALNSILSASLSILDPHPYKLHTHNTLRVTLHRFTGNLTDHLATATSTLLEMTDKKELSVLGEMYDIPVVGSFFYSRRHQSITDSSSEEESDRYANEPNSLQRPGLPHRPSSLPSPEKHRSLMYPTSSLPARNTSSPLKRLHSNSPHSHRYSFGSSPDKEDRFTQIPDRTPRLPKRASVERLRDTWSSSPRFERPRHERRITEADEEEEEFAEGETSRSSDQSVSSDDNTPMKFPRRPSGVDDPGNYTTSLPKSPPTKVNAGLGVTIPRTPILTQEREIVRSSSPFKHIPSPLSRRMSASNGLQPLRTAPLATPSSRSAPDSTTLLPSPFMQDATLDVIPLSSVPLRTALSLDPNLSTGSANPKRRSLQNMPYYSSSDDQSRPATSFDVSVGLTRTRSMPLSDLQALRSASTVGGSKSRRSSLNPLSAGLAPAIGMGMGFPSTFPANKRSSLSTLPPPSPSSTTGLRRIESVSPLTLPALKASCLGIHLKRRRLACCLLGLNFGGKTNDEYWMDVKSVLDALVDSIKEEKVMLEEVLRDTEKEVKIISILDNYKALSLGSADDNQGIENFWPTTSTSASSVFPHHRDYAPRTSDEVLLNEHIDKLSNALIGAWKELGIVKARLQEGKDDVLDNLDLDGWNAIRGQLGEGLREWERGKEVITRMKSQAAQNKGDGERICVEKGDSNHADLPEFMRSWNIVTDGGEEDDGNDEQQPSPETSLETHIDNIPCDADLRIVNQTQHQAHEDDLPPVGKDDIYEGISLPPSDKATALLSKMSREERIEMMKLARERGVSLKRFLELDADGNGIGIANNESYSQMRERGGLVVDELKGVIGSIRRMKGGGNSEEDETGDGLNRHGMEATPSESEEQGGRSLVENKHEVGGKLADEDIIRSEIHENTDMDDKRSQSLEKGTANMSETLKSHNKPTEYDVRQVYGNDNNDDNDNDNDDQNEIDDDNNCEDHDAPENTIIACGKQQSPPPLTARPANFNPFMLDMGELRRNLPSQYLVHDHEDEDEDELKHETD
uniref:Uncharacterized protein n=1 Tax=Kwoniella dejecticola CBS 10117 TaxID=1296121 RepID=A0A1A5ZYK0_9TREE|nr:uncharacterized protein I303_06444 [Kwoniella dejecticola CBS 10117]OBR82887.1 hypothetical protein I303_06444 [Kwoniella dejecticola CBS 10117]